MLQDTIAAIITPPGNGAVGVIRLSGAQAIEITDHIFRGKKLADQASHSLHFGRIVDDESNGGAPVDEVLVSLFRTPHSYTGEDVTEISCHGSPYVLQKILELCIAQGARPAKPGEFTQRAFLNGKLDLTQAEAVHDIIASENAAAHKAAMHQLRGGFSKDLRRMRDELITFAALIELELDFSEEDVEFADRTQLKDLLRQVEESTSQLINSFRLGNAMKNGVRVAIIGAPNAGKSTLLNALLNEERAIVSDIPGTTRDTVEEVMNIDGILFRFIDTAGIREHTDDVIERQGIERSLRKIAQAQVVIYLADIAQGTAEDAVDNARLLTRDSDAALIMAFNKADLIQGSAEYIHWQEAREAYGKDLPVLLLSAKDSRRGLDTVDTLKAQLHRIVANDAQPGDTIITNTRHLAALQEIQHEVEAIQRGMAQGLSGDLLSHHIRAALFQIGEITGDTVQHDRDILGTIFGKFCIGK